MPIFPFFLGGKRANTLQKVDVPILANKDCQQWYKDEKKSLIIVDTALCAGLENGGKDSCQVGFNLYPNYSSFMILLSQTEFTG